jgi:hypothetical protein
MKLKVEDPVMAARHHGGATWEPGIGWWTQPRGLSPDTGSVFHDRRSAIYLPTRTREGHDKAVTS